MPIVIGLYYEKQDGKIVKAYGWDTKSYSCYYLDDQGNRKNFSARPLETTSWKLRKDLNDFPNTRDPKLPYIFDLMYDVTYVSELKELLKTCDSQDRNILKKYIKDHKIKL